MATASRKAGFTLIELMISVAIIGVLSSTAITLFKDQQLRSKRAEGSTNVGALAKSVKTYYGDAGVYLGVAAPWPAAAPGPVALAWDAASSAAYGPLGFRPEGAVRYRYDVDSNTGAGLAECPCASNACFTVVGYSDLEGDGVGGVGLYHADVLGIVCNASLFGWGPSLDTFGNPILDSVVPLDDPIAGVPPDNY